MHEAVVAGHQAAINTIHVKLSLHNRMDTTMHEAACMILQPTSWTYPQITWPYQRQMTL